MHQEIAEHHEVAEDHACAECNQNPCACEDDYQAQLAEKLQAFGARLSRLASEAAGKRSQIEQRWLEDYRQYHGKYDPEEQAALANSGSSQVFVNITRNKSNAAEARLSDMLMPTDDRNWGIQPTPIPELANAEPGEMVNYQGQPIEKSQLARAVSKQARKAAEAMTDLIDDQLTEADYNAKSRMVIHDAVVLGTGILKGPVVIARDKKEWHTDEDGTAILSVTQELVPTVERVDPWDFFPDPSATCVEEAEYTFERRRMTSRELRAFSKGHEQTGVLIEQIKLVREAGAKSSHEIAQDHTGNLRDITGVDSVIDSNRFEMWEYQGPITKEDMLAAGMEVDEDDTLQEIHGTVHFIGQHVVKVTLNPMDTEEQPYSVFNWEEDESSIFGFGVGRQMRSEQRICNASVRMLLDNGGLSVGDQIVIDRTKIQPTNGSWALEPRKTWEKMDSEGSIRDAFATFPINSHQAELTAIFTLGRQLADEVTNLPLIAQGEQANHITQTAQGMGMLMNSANIVLRKGVKNWDDNITRRTIGRFYNFNMQFSENKEVKGDFVVDARGSSALLAKETQARNLQMLSQIAGSNPKFAELTKWEDLYRKIVQAHQVEVDDVIMTADEMKEAAEQQGEPQMPPEVQMEMQKLQMLQQTNEQELQLKQAREQREYQQHTEKMSLERELGMAKIAAAENLTMAQLQAKLQIGRTQEQNKRDIAAMKGTNEQAKMQLQNKNLQSGYDTF